VTGAKLRRGIRIVCQGQHHAGRDDTPITHDGRAIVERGVRVEEVDQQLPCQQAVNGHAALDEVLQSGLALQDDERAVAVAGKLRGRLDQFADRAFGLITGARAELRQPGTGLPELLQRAPDLRLENDRERNEEHWPGLLQHPVECGELEGGAEDEGQRQQEHDAPDELGSPGALCKPEKPIDDDRDDQDVEDVSGIAELG
jgi:hypothetical protein